MEIVFISRCLQRLVLFAFVSLMFVLFCFFYILEIHFTNAWMMNVFLLFDNVSLIFFLGQVKNNGESSTYLYRTQFQEHGITSMSYSYKNSCWSTETHVQKKWERYSTLLKALSVKTLRNTFKKVAFEKLGSLLELSSHFSSRVKEVKVALPLLHCLVSWLYWTTLQNWK